MNEALEAASETEGALRSEIIRRALRHYIQQNPDQFEAFSNGQSATSAPTTKSGNESSYTEENSIYDPAEDL